MIRTLALFLLASVVLAHSHEGNFWVFSEGNIHIVHEGAIIETIATPETTRWSDVVLSTGRHVFVNDRTTGNGQVRIYDADAYTHVSDVAVGENPVHIYYLEWRDEIWTHSDSEGHFDVIHSVDHDLIHERLTNTFDNSGHGKLGWNEDLDSFVFGGNVNDAGVYKIDLSQVGDASYVGDWLSLPECNGTHGIYYYHTTGNVYLNCLRGTGTFEIDTDGNVVNQYTWDGNLYHPYDDSWLAAVSSTLGEVYFVDMTTTTPDLENPIIVPVQNISGGPQFLLEDDHPVAYIGSKEEILYYVDLDTPTVINSISGVGELCATCYSRTITIANDGSYLGAVVGGVDGDMITLIDTETNTVTGQIPNLGRIDRVFYVPAGDEHSSEDGSSAATGLVPSVLALAALAALF